MSDSSLLDGKKILIVDDESDVLDILEELLEMCTVVRASTFDDARKLLESQDFDIAILDIMGVDGYGLLKIAYQKNITAVMLTAHAFTPENLAKAIKEGAAQIASIVCLGVRRARAWTHEAHLVGEGETLAPRVGPSDPDPDVPFEDIEITTQERLQDPDQDVVWINSLPPKHIKPLHDAIFSMSSEDAARIARFR